MARLVSWIVSVEAHGVTACVLVLAGAVSAMAPAPPPRLESPELPALIVGGEVKGVAPEFVSDKAYNGKGTYDVPGIGGGGGGRYGGVLGGPEHVIASANDDLRRALQWLLQRQSDDGLWHSSVRTTSLAYLAFARTDALHHDTCHRTMMNASIALIATDEADPVRTLALVIAADNPRSAVMTASAQQAVDGLLAAQRPDGGWGDDETTAWALVALAEALLANYDVPAAAVRRGLAHVESRTWLFGRPDAFLVAAAALVRLLDRQAATLDRTAPDHRTRYLTARALALVDRDAAAAIRRTVAAAQRDDGSWDGDVAATALAVMTLAIR